MDSVTSHESSSPLTHCFALAYSLIGAVAAHGDAALEDERQRCAGAVLTAARALHMDVSDVLDTTTSIDQLVGESIGPLRDSITDSWGDRASAAFEMGLWLGVACFAESSAVQSSLEHAEENGRQVGLDHARLTELFHELRKASGRSALVDRITVTIQVVLKDLEALPFEGEEEIKVFISYSTENQSVADEVCAGLEARGLRCWIASRDLRPAETWAAAIVEAIDACDVFVVVVSADSSRSEDVLRELQNAESCRVPIIPFRIDDAALVGGMSLYLRSIQWLDAREPPMAPHIEHLAAEVRAQVAAAEPGRPEQAPEDGSEESVSTRGGPTDAGPPPLDAVLEPSCVDVSSTPGADSETWYAVQPARVDLEPNMWAHCVCRLTNRGAAVVSVVRTQMVLHRPADGPVELGLVPQGPDAKFRATGGGRVTVNLSQGRPGAVRVEQEGQIIPINPGIPVDLEIVGKAGIEFDHDFQPIAVTMVFTDQSGHEATLVVQARHVDTGPPPKT